MKKRAFRKIFRTMRYILEFQRLVDDLVDFLKLLMFINAYLKYTFFYKQLHFWVEPRVT